MNRIARSFALVLVVCVFAVAVAPLAFAIPPLIHYQGVLRDASDNPRNGSFDMVFRFFSANVGGDEILVDRHLAAGTGAVAVTGGLFGVELGGGAVADGTGPETITSLYRVFEYPNVFLQIEIAGEILTPRTLILSSAYSLNSQRFNGYTSNSFAFTATGNTFNGLQTLLPDGTGTTLTVKASAFENAQEWQNASGLSVAAVNDQGVFSGSGASLTGVNAATVGGKAGATLLDTTATSQFKSGGLSVGDLTVSGNIINFGSSQARVIGDGTGIRLNSGFGTDDGTLIIDRDLPFEMRSGTGLFRFFNGPTASETASLDATGNFQIDGDLTVSGGDIGVPSGFNLNILSQVTLTTKANGNSLSGIDEDNNDTNRLVTWYHNGSAVQANKLMDLDENGALRIRSTLSQNSLFDLAETFFMMDLVEAGDLVSVDPSRPDAIRRTMIESDPAVVGVVSTRPGVVLGGAPFDSAALGEAWGPDVLAQFESERSAIEMELLEVEPSLVQDEDRAARLEDLALRRFHAQHFAPIALAGRVPVKVDASFGAIEAGDLLAPSPVPGVAMKATKPGPVVGTALEALREGSGKVLVLVSRGWFGGAAADGAAEGVHARLALPASTNEANQAGTIEGRILVASDLDPSEGVAPDRTSELDRAQVPSVEGVPFAFPVTVGEDVESGDVIAADAARPGQFFLARILADPAVVGITAGGMQVTWRGRAPLALPGTVVRCKVDAAYGAIRPGDMLVASPTPGHAIASAEAKPGTVIAKALEPLESGMSTILVLVQPR